MRRNRFYPRANFTTCLVRPDRSLIKERNSQLPVFLHSELTGTMDVSQRLLRNTYPAIFSDMRSSGNRRFNPIQRCSPFINSFRDYEQHALASELLKSTLQHRLCLSPLCPDFGHDPILDDQLRDLQEAVRFGDPLLIEDELEGTLGLLEAFSRLTESRGIDDAFCPGYPGSRNRSGLGQGIQLLIRDIGLRLMPSVVEGGGVEAVFSHIAIIDRIMGNNTGGVRRLIEDLRVHEQDALLQYALLMWAIDGNFLALKITRILSNEPADEEEAKAQLRQLHNMGY